MDSNNMRALLERFPRVPLGLNPTPLHRLENLERKLSYSPLFIKRDDLNGLGIGGNKVRNLEFLLGDAIAKKSDTIIVSGQTQSNLCALTASACRRLNLDCIVIHNNRRPDRPEGNALLNHLLGADERYIGEVEASARESYVAELAGQLAGLGKRPYVITNGASSQIGCLGYVQAALELALQLTSPAFSPIGSICVPGGNGGLAAGIIFGAGLLGRPFHIELITVEHEEKALRMILEDFISQLEALTGEKLPCTLDEAATIHSGFRCGGWGEISPPVEEFILEFARTEGIFVEKVYTAKTLYGMVELVREGYFDGGVCYLHSGGIGALFSQYA